MVGPHARSQPKGVGMSHLGKSHLVIMFTVEDDQVAEGDRIFESHGEWMKGHPREGGEALLEYSISKGPELSNPMDPNSEQTGRTTFVLDEYYASPAGIARHWQDAMENWADMSAAMAWSEKATVTTLHNGTAVQALW
jgi:hypothetical protein